MARRLREGFARPLAFLLKDWKLCCALLELHATADEACGGAGLVADYIDPERDHVIAFLLEANALLSSSGSLARISTDVCSVLPKARTPQAGISLRSISQNLALCWPEARVHWHSIRGGEDLENRVLNILVLPWPLSLDQLAFRSKTGPLRGMSNKFGFFEFAPKRDFNSFLVKRLIEDAEGRSGRIHGVVFPEGALDQLDLPGLEAALNDTRVIFYIAGVRGNRKNYARLGLRAAQDTFWAPYDQHKHHRWSLDASQIRTYQLGAVLHTERRWWEDIEVNGRELNFVAANDWLTMCHLICEDLARQEPVAEIIRAVGPSLVVALLLDGPQLESRWSARYATVLCDDPGSSVLSVTCLGMVARSRPEHAPPSRVVGLWRDQKRGLVKLELAPNAQGLLLSIACHWEEEFCADGRTDHGNASVLVLSGIEQICVK